MTAILIGATMLGLCLEGLTGLIALPDIGDLWVVLLVPIAVFVSVAIVIAERPFFRSGAGAMLFVLAGGVVGSLFIAVFGVKEMGSIARYTIAYAVSGGVSGVTAAGLIVWHQRLMEIREREITSFPNH